MKRMTKALSLFLAVLMLALPLAGCSSTVSSAVTSEESSQADSQPESSLPEEVRRVQLKAADAALSPDEMIEKARTMVFDSGYQDAKAFYRAFRRCTGMTPTEYRDKHCDPEEKVNE